MTLFNNAKQYVQNSDQKARALVNYVGNVVQNHVIFYPTANSLSYFWGFGFLALIFSK